MLARLSAAGDGTGLAHALGAPGAALSLERLLQSEVELEQVDRLERRRLIQNRARRILLLERKGALFGHCR